MLLFRKDALHLTKLTVKIIFVKIFYLQINALLNLLFQYLFIVFTLWFHKKGLLKATFVGVWNSLVH